MDILFGKIYRLTIVAVSYGGIEANHRYCALFLKPNIVRGMVHFYPGVSGLKQLVGNTNPGNGYDAK